MVTNDPTLLVLSKPCHSVQTSQLVSMCNADGNDSSLYSAHFGHERIALYAKDLYLTS